MCYLHPLSSLASELMTLLNKLDRRIQLQETKNNDQEQEIENLQQPNELLLSWMGKTKCVNFVLKANGQPCTVAACLCNCQKWATFVIAVIDFTIRHGAYRLENCNCYLIIILI